MSGNMQDKLGRVRKPRVHITYDVDTQGAERKKELPFVVGVMGDFSGDPTRPLAPLDERGFVEINRDTFTTVMKQMTPGLKLRVDNTLEGRGGETGSEIPIDLKFESMEDFEPARVAAQVPALKKLLDTRAKLRDLMSKADRSTELEALLETILQNKSDLERLSEDLRSKPEKG